MPPSTLPQDPLSIMSRTAMKYGNAPAIASTPTAPASAPTPPVPSGGSSPGRNVMGTTDDPSTTDEENHFINHQMLTRGGPVHPHLGVFMTGPWRGKTPDQIKEKLLADKRAGLTEGSGPGGGLRTGGLNGAGGPDGIDAANAYIHSARPLAPGALAPNEPLQANPQPAAPAAAPNGLPPANGAVQQFTPTQTAQQVSPVGYLNSRTTPGRVDRTLISPYGEASSTTAPAMGPGPRNVYIGDEKGDQTASTVARTMPMPKADATSGVASAEKPGEPEGDGDDDDTLSRRGKRMSSAFA